jgi:prepilin-type N-terminal cleavage/methylation domain-containing protein
VASRASSADDEVVTVRPTVSAFRHHLRRLRREERGYTLTELLAAMSILLIVLATLAGVFVSGSNAEADLRARFEAQSDARLALEKLRREIHNTCSVNLASAATVTLYSENAAAGYTCTVPNTWCVVATGSAYRLYRKPGTTCDATGVLWADYLTSNNVFSYTAPSAGKLPKVGIAFAIDARPGQSPRVYRLQDSIAVRNYLRS